MADIYNIDYKRLATLILPICMRSEVMQGITSPIMAALGWVRTQFSKLRDNSDYRLTHTGQVFSLRNALNDRFDSIQRRITITDNAEEAKDTIINVRADERPHFLKGDGTIIYRRGFGNSAVVSFLVCLPKQRQVVQVTPGGLSHAPALGGSMKAINEDEVRALVNTYKLAGKRYEITYN